jgi:mannose-6-phosphate isomerase-like protein (cupin superfamily)/predicted GNAT family N-acyltransferase
MMMNSINFSKISIDSAERYTWGNNCTGWHLHKSDSLSVIREIMPAGSAEEWHYHRIAKQLFYILSGRATFSINEKTITVDANENFFIEPGNLHRIYNSGSDDLIFILVSQPNARQDRVDMIDYCHELKDEIKKLNVEWLEKYFAVEPMDLIQLTEPQKEIIDKGGFIYYARAAKVIAGTFSLLKVDHDVFELGKMAVTESYKGNGIGKMMMQHAINMAHLKAIKKLILYSNTALTPAIQLYKKFGFVEVMMEAGHYQRANIKMELIL